MTRNLLLGLCLIAVGCAGERPRELELVELQGGLERGPHRVGFRKESLRLEDSSDSPSAAELYVWYPAAAEGPGGTTMRFADYYRVQAETAPSGDELRASLLADMTSPPGVDARRLDSVLETRMWAAMDADAAGGSFPLVLWSYRDRVPTMQALLNEYLASHGYVVVFAWPTDRVPPFPWHEGLTVDQKAHALDVQTDMLEAVLAAVIARPSIDRDRVSVLAWSYGGESAGALQRRRNEVGVVIGVDATIVSGWVYRPGAETSIDPAELSAPYVLIRNGRPRVDSEPSAEPPLLAEIPAGSWFVRLPELSHGNFNFPGGMVPGVLSLEDVSDWAVGGELARLGYEMICDHVLGVLDHYLRGIPAEPSNWSERAPPGFVEIERHHPR